MVIGNRFGYLLDYINYLLFKYIIIMTRRRPGDVVNLQLFI